MPSRARGVGPPETQQQCSRLSNHHQKRHTHCSPYPELIPKPHSLWLWFQNGVQLVMKVDTGAVASRRLWSDAPGYRELMSALRTYTGERIKIKCTISVSVHYDCEEYSLDLLVVEGDGPFLMERNYAC